MGRKIDERSQPSGGLGMGIERPSFFLLIPAPLGSPLSSRSPRSSPFFSYKDPNKEPCPRVASSWQVTCYKKKSHSIKSDANETAVFTTIFVIEAFWILSCMLKIYLSGR